MPRSNNFVKGDHRLGGQKNKRECNLQGSDGGFNLKHLLILTSLPCFLGHKDTGLSLVETCQIVGEVTAVTVQLQEARSFLDEKGSCCWEYQQER